MISVDPANPAIAVSGVSNVVNFVGEYGITITGAQNIKVPGVSHMGILESPAVQQRILSEAILHRTRLRR